MCRYNQLPVRTAKIRRYDPITSRQLIETHFGRAEIQNERFLNIRKYSDCAVHTVHQICNIISQNTTLRQFETGDARHKVRISEVLPVSRTATGAVASGQAPWATYKNAIGRFSTPSELREILLSRPGHQRHSPLLLPCRPEIRADPRKILRGSAHSLSESLNISKIWKTHQESSEHFFTGCP